MGLLSLTRFARRTDTTPEPWPVSWGDLTAALSRFEFRASKDGPLWSPAEYPPGATRGSGKFFAPTF